MFSKVLYFENHSFYPPITVNFPCPFDYMSFLFYNERSACKLEFNPILMPGIDSFLPITFPDPEEEFLSLKREKMMVKDIFSFSPQYFLSYLIRIPSA